MLSSHAGRLDIVRRCCLTQAQCFDADDTRMEFQVLETFGFLPVPPILMGEARERIEVKRARSGR